MPSLDLVVDTPVKASGRVLQVEGQFDMSREERRSFKVIADLPIEDRAWQIGAIIGPSGSGKSTILRQLGKTEALQWDSEASVLDGFPSDLTVQEVTRMLNSVGFSSPPAWVRPFGTLSNGEQFRATVARLLCSDADPVLIDEFTSVVDRTVAKVGSTAVAKHLRRTRPDCHLIVASCHEDIIDWLQPDWVYETGGGMFSWRSLQPRPRIAVEIYRTTPEAWRFFAHHHYLTHAPVPKMSFCTVACVDGEPAAWVSSIAQMGQVGVQRGSRGVTLPDFQGIGLGNAVGEFHASLFKAIGRRFRGVSTHPAYVQHWARSPLWRIDRMPSIHSAQNVHERGGVRHVIGSERRLTTSAEYVGPAASLAEAHAFGLKGSEHVGV